MTYHIMQFICSGKLSWFSQISYVTTSTFFQWKFLIVIIVGVSCHEIACRQWYRPVKIQTVQEVFLQLSLSNIHLLGYLSNYLDRHLMYTTLNSFIAAASWWLTIKIIKSPTLTHVSNGESTNDKNFSCKFQPDLAATKVFHQKIVSYAYHK